MAKLPQTQFETELQATLERELRDTVDRLHRAADELRQRVLGNTETFGALQKQFEAPDNPLFGAIEHASAVWVDQITIRTCSSDDEAFTQLRVTTPTSERDIPRSHVDAPRLPQGNYHFIAFAFRKT